MRLSSGDPIGAAAVVKGFVPSEAHLIRLITLGVRNSFKFIFLPLGSLVCVRERVHRGKSETLPVVILA